MVAIDGDYEPSALDWVREQVEVYDRTDGAEAALDKMGVPIVVVTMRGRRTGKVRKVGLIRVERDGDYALVGSFGGAPADPDWVHNLRAHAGPVTTCRRDARSCLSCAVTTPTPAAAGRRPGPCRDPCGRAGPDRAR